MPQGFDPSKARALRPVSKGLLSVEQMQHVRRQEDLARRGLLTSEDAVAPLPNTGTIGGTLPVISISGSKNQAFKDVKPRYKQGLTTSSTTGRKAGSGLVMGGDGDRAGFNDGDDLDENPLAQLASSRKRGRQIKRFASPHHPRRVSRDSVASGNDADTSGIGLLDSPSPPRARTKSGGPSRSPPGSREGPRLPGVSLQSITEKRKAMARRLDQQFKEEDEGYSNFIIHDLSGGKNTIATPNVPHNTTTNNASPRTVVASTSVHEGRNHSGAPISQVEPTPPMNLPPPPASNPYQQYSEGESQYAGAGPGGYSSGYGSGYGTGGSGTDGSKIRDRRGEKELTQGRKLKPQLRMTVRPGFLQQLKVSGDGGKRTGGKEDKKIISPTSQESGRRDFLKVPGAREGPKSPSLLTKAELAGVLTPLNLSRISFGGEGNANHLDDFFKNQADYRVEQHDVLPLDTPLQAPLPAPDQQLSTRANAPNVPTLQVGMHRNETTDSSSSGPSKNNSSPDASGLASSGLGRRQSGFSGMMGYTGGYGYGSAGGTTKRSHPTDSPRSVAFKRSLGAFGSGSRRARQRVMTANDSEGFSQSARDRHIAEEQHDEHEDADFINEFQRVHSILDVPGFPPIVDTHSSHGGDTPLESSLAQTPLHYNAFMNFSRHRTRTLLGGNQSPDADNLSATHTSTGGVLETARAEKFDQDWKALQAKSFFRGRAVYHDVSKRQAVDEEAKEVDWNAEFHKLLEKPCLGPTEAQQRGEELVALRERFRDAVLPLVEHIIFEHNVPDRQKVIPLESVGGFAGGDKYFYGDILLKFAATPTTQKLYGKYEYAIKSATNELKGLNALIQANVPHLHFPLGMVVTFLGHRTWVASRVPIGKGVKGEKQGTLVYGSADGGVNVLTDPEAAKLMDQAAKVMNLKEHMVGAPPRGTEHLNPDPDTYLKEVSGPIDIEIHKGEDGRYYMLDTARMFPPDPNESTGRPKNFHLHKLLRPEHVRAAQTPLSSDAWCAFGKHNRYVNDGEVTEVASLLTRNCIPHFVRQLPGLMQQASVRALFDLKKHIHGWGINLRYLGHILDEYYHYCNDRGVFVNQCIVTHLCCEMIARTFKVLANEELYWLSNSMNATNVPTPTAGPPILRPPDEGGSTSKRTTLLTRRTSGSLVRRGSSPAPAGTEEGSVDRSDDGPGSEAGSFHPPRRGSHRSEPVVSLLLDEGSKGSERRGSNPHPGINLIPMVPSDLERSARSTDAPLVVTDPEPIGLSDYHQRVIDMLNKCFNGDSDQGKRFWEQVLIKKMVEKFPCKESTHIMMATFYSVDSIMPNTVNAEFFHSLLFEKISEQLGLEWQLARERDLKFYHRLGNNDTASRGDLITLPLLQAMRPVVKMATTSPFMQVAQLVEGNQLERAAELYVDEIALRQHTLGETVKLVPLLTHLCVLYSQNNWPDGKARKSDALNVCRRIVRLYQEDAEIQTMLAEPEKYIGTAAKKAITQVNFQGAPNSSLVFDASESGELSRSPTLNGTQQFGATQQFAAIPALNSTQPYTGSPLLTEAQMEAKRQLAHRESLVMEYVESLNRLGNLVLGTHVEESIAVLSTAFRLGGLVSGNTANRTIIARTRGMLGLAFKEKGKSLEAAREFQAAAGIGRAIYNADPTEENAGRYIEAACSYAMQASLLGHKAEAIQQAETAMEVAAKVFRQPEPPLTSSFEVPSLTNTGHGQTKLAATDRDAGPTIANMSKVGSHYYAQCVLRNAQVRIEGVAFVGELAKTLEQCTEALQLLENTFTRKSPAFCEALLVYTQVLRVAGNFNEGIRACEELLASLQRLYGRQSIECADCYIELALFSFCPWMEGHPSQVKPVFKTLDAPAVFHAGDLLPRRFNNAHTYLQQAIELLGGPGVTHPLVAKALTLQAQLVRLTHLASPLQAYKGVVRAIAIYESLGILSSVEYVQAINVYVGLTVMLMKSWATLKAAATGSNATTQQVLAFSKAGREPPVRFNPNAILADIYKALAASDRHMSVADSDFVTQTTLGYLLSTTQTLPQEYRLSSVKSTKFEISRDGRLRKLAGLVQLTALNTFYDEQLEAAASVRAVVTLYRDLFPFQQEWDTGAELFVPTLRVLASWLMKGNTGGQTTPVGEVGIQLMKLVRREEEKKTNFDERTKREAETAQQRKKELDLQRQHARVENVLAAARRHIDDRELSRGVGLLHRAIGEFRTLYPDGANPDESTSITLHNLIVGVIEYVKRLVNDNKYDYGMDKKHLKQLLTEHVLPAAQESLIDVRGLSVASPTGVTPTMTPRFGEGSGLAHPPFTPRTDFAGFTDEERERARPQDEDANKILQAYRMDSFKK